MVSGFCTWSSPEEMYWDVSNGYGLVTWCMSPDAKVTYPTTLPFSHLLFPLSFLISL